MGTRKLLIPVAILLIALSAGAVTTKDMATGSVTADDVVKTLTGAGVTISNVKITGSQKAIGTFTGGVADGLGIDVGVIMSTGDIATAAGPNTSEGTSGNMGTPGDGDLDQLVKPYKTHDAIILEFDAVTAGSGFSIKYIFVSEEYKEWVGSQFNDVFAFFVDGQNIALVPGTIQPVAVNTVNFKTNSALYKDNPAGSKNFGTSFDGFTTELTAVATVSSGTTHHIKLAIADTSDSILDSAVFLAKGGISGSDVAAAVIPDVPELLVSNLDENDMVVTVYGVPEGVTPDMSASGLPDDTVVTFQKTGSLGPNAIVYNMHIKIGADTAPGVYTLLIRAGIGDTETFGTVLVIVDCVPPMILSAPGSQPANASIKSGSSTKLTVKPNGTSAFRYQWYVGHTGATRFPIAGARSASYTTPALTTSTEYWVRVLNPCGTTDSASAMVTVTP
jgi:Ig-like domain CHU_C associated